jgi:hypothetical protein
MEQARNDAETLVRRYAPQIQQLARERMQARWMEMTGAEVERSLAQSGVKRAGTPDYPRPNLAHGRAPQPG